MTSKDWRPTAFVETTPGIVSEEEADAGRVEQRKATCELVRHLMTLDSTLLALTAAFVDKAFAQPLHRWTIGLAVGALLASLVAAGIAYLALLAHRPRAGAVKVSPGESRMVLAATAMTFLGFLVGVAALAGFFLGNWFR